jgi:hypothetical protein
MTSLCLIPFSFPRSASPISPFIILWFSPRTICMRRCAILSCPTSNVVTKRSCPCSIIVSAILRYVCPRDKRSYVSSKWCCTINYVLSLEHCSSRVIFANSIGTSLSVPSHVSCHSTIYVFGSSNLLFPVVTSHQ